MYEDTIQLTIFTPTYNRKHTLPRLFQSLKTQHDYRFIWLIIDDGSDDGTEELVKEWQKERLPFEIRYHYKSNGGMHTAHNSAYKLIDTELNMCIDSDDKLAPGAIEIILHLWNDIGRKLPKCAGIIGLDVDFSGAVIGKRFPDELTRTTLSGYYASGGKGDKKLVYRTDIMKSLPEYPVFEGEKYNSLAYKYLLCDQYYYLLTTNSSLCEVEYQTEGSTKSMYRQYLNNPKGFAFTRKVDMILYPASLRRLFVTGIHYCSSSFIAKDASFIRNSPRKILTVLCIIPGFLLTIYIKLAVKFSYR